MLDTLRIDNIAVIEFADIKFDKGFCALTGETGAGKSILIDSLGAVLGNRTSRDLVRRGCESARVTAVFTDCNKSAVKALTDAGFDCDDGTVMLSRQITADGKSRSRINGLPATTAVVKEISKHLVATVSMTAYFSPIPGYTTVLWTEWRQTAPSARNISFAMISFAPL